MAGRSDPRPFSVLMADGAELVGERRGSAGGVPVVLLHAGVADRRGWHEVLHLLADVGEGPALDLLAYDRRGFGATADPTPSAAFTHLADLVAVLDAAGFERAVLVGNSMGGALALDAALTAADRVAGLLLIGAAVSGMTDEGEAVRWQPDPATGALLGRLEAAQQAGDVEEQVRLQLHLWLDGPTAAEGRVGGDARALAAAMNRRVLLGGAGEAGDPGLDTWHRLGSIAAPGLAVWGDLDLPPDLPFYGLTAARLPAVDARVLPGVAHLPSLEQPQRVADLVREVVAAIAPATPAP